MPDLFVPIEKEGYNKLYEEIFKKNLVHTFALKFSDEHRNELNRVKRIEDLNAFFRSVPLMVSFKKHILEKGVKCPEKLWNASSPRLKAVLYGLIGRSTRLDDEAFYYYINQDDINIQKAINRR